MRLITAGFAVLIGACSSVPRLLTPVEYRKIRHVVPYIIDVSCNAAHLVYVGSHHLNDPDHAQIRLIEHLWEQLQPEVAFNEGGNPPTASTREEAVTKYGEPGLVRFLAARDKVPVRSIDPRRRDIARALMGRFTPEQIKMYWALLQVKEHRANPYESFEERMSRAFVNLKDVPGFDGPPRNVAELEDAYSRHFPGSVMREVPDAWFDPMDRINWMNDVALAMNDVRDHFMIDQLAAEMKNGKRVFAVVGASHVVVQEPLLRSRICAGSDRPAASTRSKSQWRKADDVAIRPAAAQKIHECSGDGGR